MLFLCSDRSPQGRSPVSVDNAQEGLLNPREAVNLRLILKLAFSEQKASRS
jgi:hypothetical protein